ncbi:hypothetical protein H0E87_031591, partial [Populus deltoides]
QFSTARVPFAVSSTVPSLLAQTGTPSSVDSAKRVDKSQHRGRYRCGCHPLALARMIHFFSCGWPLWLIRGLGLPLSKRPLLEACQNSSFSFNIKLEEEFSLR